MQKRHPTGWRLFKNQAIRYDDLVLAESVRFELTVGFPITSFQDWLLKPLGQLSICSLNHTIFRRKSQGSG